MSTYEILTIILTVISGLIAVSAILVPIILNYLTKRAENKKKNPKEQDKMMYKEYCLNYMKLVDELSLCFSNYLVSQIRDNKATLICVIYKLKIISDHSLKGLLNELLKEVQSEVFNKAKLLTAFEEYLEKLNTEHLHIYWYGDSWSKGHSDLIKNSN